MTVTDDAILKIRRMITSGELGPGDRLPPEKELSDQLGISRNSLREAVKALEVIRVLDVRRGDGTYVTSLEPRMLLEAMSFVVDLHSDRSVLEILEVRRLLEPAAAARAAHSLDEEGLDALHGLFAGVDDARAPSDIGAHDMAFHRAIADAAGNEYLARLLESMFHSTARAREWRGIAQGGAVDRTIAEHRAIFDALEHRDADLAAALMLAHIAGVEEWISAVGGHAATADREDA